MSVTFVQPTQPVEVFGNFSSPFTKRRRKIAENLLQGQPFAERRMTVFIKYCHPTLRKWLSLAVTRRAFSVAAPYRPIWNSLPAELRLCHRTATFKRHLKTSVYSQLVTLTATSASASSEPTALYKYRIVMRC